MDDPFLFNGSSDPLRRIARLTQAKEKDKKKSSEVGRQGHEGRPSKFQASLRTRRFSQRLQRTLDFAYIKATLGCTICSLGFGPQNFFMEKGANVRRSKTFKLSLVVAVDLVIHLRARLTFSVHSRINLCTPFD